jgi:hypothetical protein
MGGFEGDALAVITAASCIGKIGERERSDDSAKRRNRQTRGELSRAAVECALAKSFAMIAVGFFLPRRSADDECAERFILTGESFRANTRVKEKIIFWIRK